ncbi:MAG: hypothetical protein KDI51_12545 [Xanthomonadales bacterium]|nr:hypothetical protein [Xanthomonadales bacterium]
MKPLTLFAALGLLPAVGLAQGFGQFEIKARDGDPVPGSSRTLALWMVQQPVISEAGHVAFASRTEQQALDDCLFTLQGNAQNQLTMPLCEEQSVPAGNARYSIFDRWRIDDTGSITAYARLENVTQFGSRGVYRAHPDGRVEEVIRGETALGPGLAAVCNSALSHNDVHIEDNGELRIAPALQQGSSCVRNAVFAVDRQNQVRTMASLGSAISNQSGSLSSLNGELLSDGAGVLYASGRESGVSTQFWYLVGSGSVARSAADRNDDVYAAQGPVLNVFDSSTDVVTAHTGTGPSVTERLHRGQSLPQGQGQFFNVRALDVAPDNRMVATIELTGTPNGSSDDSGIYLFDEFGVVEVAREGQPALVPGAVFTNLPDFTTFATIGRGGRVLFEARYRVGSASSVRGWFYYDRQTGLREFLNGNTMVDGLQVRNWSVGPRFNERGELPLFLSLSDDSDVVAIYRLPGSSFGIQPAITGAWFDPAQAGHGLFVEVLPDQRFLAWWFTFSPGGEQAWFGGVGVYQGGVAVVPLTKTAGGRFIPNFDPTQVSNPPFGTLTITYSSCDSGLLEFDLPDGYGQGSMALTRLTLPAGLSCTP